MRTVLSRNGRPPAPKPPSRPGWLFAMTAALLLLVWAFSPIWLAVLVTAFWLLAFLHGGGPQ